MVDKDSKEREMEEGRDEKGLEKKKKSTEGWQTDKGSRDKDGRQMLIQTVTKMDETTKKMDETTTNMEKTHHISHPFNLPIDHPAGNSAHPAYHDFGERRLKLLPVYQLVLCGIGLVSNLLVKWLKSCLPMKRRQLMEKPPAATGERHHK